MSSRGRFVTPIDFPRQGRSRTEGCTYAAKVWDLSSFMRRSFAPRPNPNCYESRLLKRCMLPALATAAYLSRLMQRVLVWLTTGRAADAQVAPLTPRRWRWLRR
jgi:hypothetical protein